MRAIELVSPSARELMEMENQLAEPFILESTEMLTQLSLAATPLDKALEITLDAYRTAAKAASSNGPPR